MFMLTKKVLKLSLKLSLNVKKSSDYLLFCTELCSQYFLNVLPDERLEKIIPKFPSSF